MAKIRDTTESSNQIVKYLELQKNDFKTDTLYRLYKGRSAQLWQKLANQKIFGVLF